MLRLGVNIDHVATLRNARGGAHPCPIKAALNAKEAGADGITAHLREDRRHIRDEDMRRLKREIDLPLNFEMAATEEMQEVALEVQPNAVCLVPEKREELTTEGGLNVAEQIVHLGPYIAPFKEAGIRVSLFVDPDPVQIESAAAVGADIVELHTGSYCHSPSDHELKRLVDASALTDTYGLECHAGHGITYDTVTPIATIPQMVELNIGHFLIGEAVFDGLPTVIQKMRNLMNGVRV